MILEYPIIAQPKLDGFRIQVHIYENGDIQLFSRSLKEKTNSFPDILMQLSFAHIDAGIYDAEIYGIENGRPMSFERFQHRLNAESNIDTLVKEYPCVIRLFDILYYDGKDVTGLVQTERRKILEQYPSILLEEIVVNNKEEVLSYYDKCIADGHEGIMLKRMDGLYLPGQGKSSFKNFLKYKPARLTFDVVITGARFGDGKNSDVLASFDIAVLDKGSLYPVGACGLGFDREDMEELTDRITSNMTAIGWTKEGNDCCEIDISNPIIIEVKSDKVMHNDSGGYGLRFPRFVRFRPDKELEDIDTIDIIKEYM